MRQTKYDHNAKPQSYELALNLKFNFHAYYST